MTSPQNPISPGQLPPSKLDDTHLFQALIKEYELATNRLDKTDDRIIQLVGIGLAALGAIFVFLRQEQASSTASFPVPIPGLTSTKLDSHVWEDAILALIIFTGLYAILFFIFTYLYLRRGLGNPLPNRLFSLASSRSTNRKVAISRLYRLYNEAMRKGPEELNGFKKDWKTLKAYEELDKWSFRRMKFAYAFPPLFGTIIIPIVEIWLAPDLRNQANLPAVELLWLLALLFTGFNSLLIYVMYYSFSHLWLCRVLSHRLNTLVRRKILLRFDYELTPSRLFSYSTGNWKPRMSYWLLLGSVGALFCSMLLVFSAQIYVKSFWQSSFFLAFYAFLMFLQLFALSGIRHDLHNRHAKFIEEQEEYMMHEWGIAQTQVK